jgi:hypothetical protein
MLLACHVISETIGRRGTPSRAIEWDQVAAPPFQLHCQCTTRTSSMKSHLHPPPSPELSHARSCRWWITECPTRCCPLPSEENYRHGLTPMFVGRSLVTLHNLHTSPLCLAHALFCSSSSSICAYPSEVIATRPPFYRGFSEISVPRSKSLITFAFPPH